MRYQSMFYSPWKMLHSLFHSPWKIFHSLFHSLFHSPWKWCNNHLHEPTDVVAPIPEKDSCGRELTMKLVCSRMILMILHQRHLHQL